MTEITPNTFLGPNQGNAEGYIPETTIESAKIDADLNQIAYDLDNLLSAIQSAYVKLDQIDLESLGAITANDVVPIINASALKIDADNLADNVVIDSELISAISSHKNTTTLLDMHPETSIKSTELTYSNTPTTLITNCANLLDELKNIRYQIKRITGATNWSDVPPIPLNAVLNYINDIVLDLAGHVNSSILHLSYNEYLGVHYSHNPSAENPYATISDVTGLGSGDMTKAVYDTNNNGVVDKATALVYGTTTKDYTDIVSKIATDITTHKNIVSAHHTRYTNAEAIGAINGDTDHSATATHYYSDLLGKPAADGFSSSQVTNLRINRLADGSAPWVGSITLANNGYIPTNNLPIEYINSSWSEASSKVATRAFLSSSTSGSVSDTFGPTQCMLLGGIGYVTTDYGYLQYSVNGGSTWNSCTVSPALVRSPSSGGNNMSVWTCPVGVIPAGSTFKIRAGSTFSGSSGNIFGAGYHIRYKYI